MKSSATLWSQVLMFVHLKQGQYSQVDVRQMAQEGALKVPPAKLGDA